MKTLIGFVVTLLALAASLLALRYFFPSKETGHAKSTWDSAKRAYSAAEAKADSLFKKTESNPEVVA